jgi:hypothetical protein
MEISERNPFLQLIYANKREREREKTKGLEAWPKL